MKWWICLSLCPLSWGFVDSGFVASLVTPSAVNQTQTGCLDAATGFAGRCNCPTPLHRVWAPLGESCAGAVKDCVNGVYSPGQDRCTCDANFKYAGITDVTEWESSVCTQFQCQSNLQCASLTGIADAECFIEGWNCDCGFENAGRSNGVSQCMWPWYVFLARSIVALKWFCVIVTIGTPVVAVLLLPFGKNVVGAADEYSVTLFSHDFAWSAFALKVGVWTYLAVLVVMGFLFTLFAVSVVVATLIIAICMAVAAIFSAMCGIGRGGGNCCSGNGPCCNGCNGCRCSSADCCGGDCCCDPLCCSNCIGRSCPGGNACGPCCDACFTCGRMVPPSPDHVGASALYVTDPCPFYDPYIYGYTYGPRECDCNCCPLSDDRRRRQHQAAARQELNGGCCDNCWKCCLWMPAFKFLASVFPRIPENMLGGVLGYCVGTHPLHNSYDEESCIVERLRNPCCVTMVNRSEHWRTFTFEWLYGRQADEAVAEIGETVAEAERYSNSETISYGGVEVIEHDCPLSELPDRIQNADDYEDNECWICRSSKPEWDLWTSCGHTFCKDCSHEMLRRRMYCPFCRVRSAVVLRGKCAETVGESRVQMVQARASGPGQMRMSRSDTQAAARAARWNEAAASA